MRNMLKTMILPMLALAAAAPALAQGEPAPTAGPSAGFGRMWTPWTGVTRESSEAEAAAARRGRIEAQAEAPAAIPANATQAIARHPAQGAALGERVGEVVRTGDCEAGERMAREAGDFALVQAVRDHCRPRRPNP